MMRLVASGLEKHYGATRALAGLSMELHAGEITGIAGPNGAGKSTLTRMLAGEERADSGEIRLHRPQGTVADEIWRRVAVVHQEPQIWPNMTVRENLVVGRSLRSAAVDSAMDKLGIMAFADYQLADLSLAVCQRVEIARALLCDADVFLFDEPNSALTEEESAALFEIMRQLSDEGRIVLLITHRLSDFVRCCQRVLVLRDGTMHAELRGAQLSEVNIARQLTDSSALNSRVSRSPLVPGTAQGPTQPLVICAWTDAGRAFHDISLNVPAGRVIAFAGVEGSGARELVQALGAYRKLSADSGRAGFPLKGPGAVRVSYLAASRRHTVFSNMSVGENLLARMGWRDLSRPVPLWSQYRADDIAAAALLRYRVKAGGIAHPISSLSGGNQQKVALGAAMGTHADLLAVEEPTRGVDIASSADIYRLIREFAASGKFVVLYCTEPREIHDVADDVVVLSHGRIAGRIDDLQAIANVVELAERIATLECRPANNCT